ncbi:hypothetical protein PVW53_11455 [Seohaeicola sp. SP36]|nr:MULTISPECIES: hypothetical protein [unclassified Seohaeicola]MDD9736141.1 hypothetical protein [Seohaeicola sp. SP36]
MIHHGGAGGADDVAQFREGGAAQVGCEGAMKAGRIESMSRPVAARQGA